MTLQSFTHNSPLGNRLDLTRLNRPIYVVLLHSPMVDRIGREVTTAVTNLDIHDIARSCRTYGITKYFIVNPEPEQERLVKNILGHWHEEVSKTYHPARAEALSLVSFVKTFEEAFNEASFQAVAGSQAAQQSPYVVMPDARDLSGDFNEIWSYEELRRRLESCEIPGDKSGGLSGIAQDGGQQSILRPVMIVFGTGWGISPSFFGHVDRSLKPLRKGVYREGERGYNHLSVRAAAAIILDRLFGDRG